MQFIAAVLHAAVRLCPLVRSIVADDGGLPFLLPLLVGSIH